MFDKATIKLRSNVDISWAKQSVCIREVSILDVADMRPLLKLYMKSSLDQTDPLISVCLQVVYYLCFCTLTVFRKKPKENTCRLC